MAVEKIQQCQGAVPSEYLIEKILFLHHEYEMIGVLRQREISRNEYIQENWNNEKLEKKFSDKMKENL